MGAVNFVVLVCVLRAANEKGRQLIRGKKCTPEKILATPMSIGRVAYYRKTELMTL